MYSPNLFLHVNALKVVQVCLAFSFRVAIKAMDSSLLPPSELILCNGLSRDRVKHIASLTGETLQVVGHICMGNV